MLSRLVLALILSCAAALRVSPVAKPKLAPLASGVPAAVAAFSLVEPALALDVGGTDVPAAALALPVLAIGGFAAVQAKKKAEEDEEKRLATIRRNAEIKRMETQRDRLSAQVSLGVPVVVVVLFILFRFIL